MSVTKAKINLKEGTIELEGNEAFVSKYLDAFKQEMQKNVISFTETSIAPKEEAKVEAEKGRKKPGKIAQTIIPIPLDLKGKDSKPSLRDFYKQKQPTNLSESVTVFAYYLKEYLKIGKMEAGHVASCCKEVGIKIPTNIPQMFYDIQHHNGWLNPSDGRKFAEINTAGENFVIHDLPRKKDVTGNKTAT